MLLSPLMQHNLYACTAAAIQQLTVRQLQTIAGLFILGERTDSKEWGASQPSWHSPALSISVHQACFSRYIIL